MPRHSLREGLSKRKMGCAIAYRLGSMRGRYAMATFGRKEMVCFGAHGGRKRTFKGGQILYLND